MSDSVTAAADLIQPAIIWCIQVASRVYTVGHVESVRARILTAAMYILCSRLVPFNTLAEPHSEHVWAPVKEREKKRLRL